MRRAAIILALTVTTGAGAGGATADAQSVGLAAAYGGGGLPIDPPKRTRAVADGLAVALAPAGDTMRVRVSIGMPCSNIAGGLNSDDLLLRVALAADGSYTGVNRLRSARLGRTRVRITGIATPERATGTVRVRSLKGRQRCRSGRRAFVAKPVDPSLAPEPPRGPPVPGALLVGLTTEASSIPHGFVARIGSDGQIARLFFARVQRCRAEGQVAPRSRYLLERQTARVDAELTDGRYEGLQQFTETPAEHRRGIRFAAVERLSVVVSDAGLRATFESRERYHEPGYADHCTTAPMTLRAVPA